MASATVVASPVVNRGNSMQETVLPHHQVLPTSPGRSTRRSGAVVPRRRRFAEEDGLAGRRLPAPLEHTSEDVLLRVLQDDAPLDLPLGSTISHLRLRLNLKKGWYRSDDCLLYGGRQLLADKKVRDVVDAARASADKRFLHLFVQAEDIAGVSVASRRKPRASALTRSLSRMSVTSELSRPSSTDELQLVDEVALATDVAPAGSPLNGVSARPPSPLTTSDVIHLVIRKTAHVSWQHVGVGQFELTVRVTDTVASVKERLAGLDDGTSDRHALLYNGFQLDSNKPLSEYNLGRDGQAVLELVPLEPAPSGGGALAKAAGPRSYPDGSPMLSSPVHSLFGPWQRANSGLRAGKMPALAPSGSGGSYLMRDAQGQIVAVFKPVDEEPNAVNNPRGYHDTHSDYGMRVGILPGEGAFREVAAYVLDHGHRAGVPATAMVYAEMPEGALKYGSLQAFVVADCDCEEMGPSAFPVAEVHNIAILDCRLANTDRNASNILARREEGGWRLFPIDHGYCLPATLDDISLEWTYWPQAKVPFSDEAREYIATLDAEYDLSLLRERNIPLRPACARVFRATTLVLKRAAARGLSPYDVATILQRPPQGDSPLEGLHREACKLACKEEEVLRRRDNKLAHRTGLEIVPFNPAVPEPESDVIYIAQLSTLLEAYLDQHYHQSEALVADGQVSA